MAVSRAAVIPGPRGVNRVVYLREEREACLAEAEDIRDTAALLEGQARDTKREAQALIAKLVADNRRRKAFGPQQPASRGLATGVQLRRARDLAHVSQRQLASTWGYSRGAIAAYEDGQSPRRIPEGICAWALQVLRVAGEEAD